MKNILTTIIVTSLILCLILCLGGCSDNPNIESTNDDSVKFWIDEQTGVQYVIYSHKKGYAGMGGITPRLNADGTLYHSTGGVE